MIIIVNSFFEYGFMRRGKPMSSGEGSSSMTPDEEEEWSGGPLSSICHYWEYITINFPEIESVLYINHYYEEATTYKEKALGWIMLALNQKSDLHKVFLESFSNIPILELYRKEDSYFWQNRKEVLDSLKFL